MPRRDPETGQFVSDSHTEASYGDVETVLFNQDFSVPASENSGSTGQNYGEGNGWAGFELVDMGKVLDRDERAEVIRAMGRLVVTLPSTATADGTVRGIAEIGWSNGPVADDLTADYQDVDKPTGIQAAERSGDGDAEESIDVLGRPMTATTGAQFSDSATGVGGSAGQGDDDFHVVHPPGFAPMVDERDILYTSGAIEVSNVADQASHAEIVGRVDVLVHEHDQRVR